MNTGRSPSGIGIVCVMTHSTSAFSARKVMENCTPSFVPQTVAATRATRPATSHTTNQTTLTIVTIRKLGGMLNIADSASPAHTATSANTVETAMAAVGRAVSMMAVAAGVTNSANNSSVPTACTAMVTASPSSAMKMTDSRRTGTPLASATAGLTDANNSGRNTKVMTTVSTTTATANSTSWRPVTANRFPNRMLVTVLLLRVASELKNRPRPVAAASTVPVATSRSSARLPSAPITSAPPMQNTASPAVTGRPSSTAPVAPGNPMCARACAANAVLRTMMK